MSMLNYTEIVENAALCSWRNNSFAKPSEKSHEIDLNDISACSLADEVSLIISFENYKNMFALFNILSFWGI